MDGSRDRRRDRLTTLRLLDPARPYKPLDVGNGIVSGTVSATGGLLSLGAAHPRHGRVVLTAGPTPPADDAGQAAIRAYRAGLASPQRAGFGLALRDRAAASFLLDERWPVQRLNAIEIVTVAPPGRSGVVQRARGMTGGALAGAPRLMRAAYTQLTPGGRLPDVAKNELDAAFAIRVGSDAGGTYLAVALATSAADADTCADALLRDAPALVPEVPRDGRADGTTAHRALAYCLDCAVSRLDDGTLAIVADHEILPLVWTRDAYYVVHALTALVPDGNAIASAFLRWLFERAERPGGWWPRASLASGQAKDPQFQLDQQLYPLLLALETGSHVAEARMLLDALLERRTGPGLIATAETPADDPIALPFHFSSHVLLWHVLDRFGHPAATAIRATVLERFSDAGRFAYAIDGAGAVRHYHDANDLPTVFAPGWRFCEVADPRWRATIEFAWSTANAAFFPGPLGGLGSLHTPHPWPLGDLQELVVARLLGDPARIDRAIARLRAVETWDGLLPEAYDEMTGAVASRHWFAWPVALRALLLADAARVTP